MASVFAVTLPTGVATLVVPAAVIAEVVAVPGDLIPLRHAGNWVLGRFRWRNRPVTLVSFERLAADAALPVWSRVCVFHSLSGSATPGYFALATTGVPRSIEIGEASGAAAVPEALSGAFIAGVVDQDGQALVIPDLEAVQAALSRPRE